MERKSGKLTRDELKELRKKLDSKEEQELIRWSVELGRKANRGAFKRLLAELSPEVKQKLLSGLPPSKRAGLLK